MSVLVRPVEGIAGIESSLLLESDTISEREVERVEISQGSRFLQGRARRQLLTIEHSSYRDRRTENPLNYV